MSDNSRCSSLCHGGDESVGNILGGPDTDEIVLSIAESLVVFSMAFALCRACEYLRALEHNENPVIAGLLPDREEAFATAVSGLSGIISTANSWL